MRLILRCLIVFFIIFILSVVVYGEEKKKWSEQAELSYVETGGNTDVKTLSAKNILKYKFDENLEGVWKGKAIYGESDGERDAEKYSTELRLNYLFTERFYSAFFAGWLKDNFAGIDSEYTVGPAVGYKLFDGPRHFLLSEAGVNYVKKEYTEGQREENLGGRVFSSYEYAFTEKNRFSQSVEYIHNFEDSSDYYLNSETALISSLNSFLSLKASYLVEYRHKPVPSTLDDTDTTLAVALVVNF
jgi:putative salt-induced outer membrane protein YdiY